MDKNIIITGCSSGIGLNSAQILKHRGWHVLATARKPQDVKNLANLGFDAYQLDLDSSENIQSFIQTIINKTNGKIDALFNNAGYGQPGAVEDLTRQAIRQQFESNVFGLLELTNYVIPIMRRQNHGRLIFNSSLLGIVAMPYRGAYNASKFAMEGLIDTLRLELYNTQIKVSLIEPGPIESQFRANAFTQFKKNIIIEKSVHKKEYLAMIDRLSQVESTLPFTLPADAVTKKLIHALEHKRPKAHYAVTIPTNMAFFLRRVLPTSWLDIIARIAGR